MRQALFSITLFSLTCSILQSSPSLASTVLTIQARPQIKHVKFDSIQLGEKVYQIPEPWTGNRIPAPALPFSAFSAIPAEHTKNGSRLYITAETQEALLKLLAQAKEDGLHLRVESGYRSPAYQKKIFMRMLDEGRVFEDIVRYVAPPGYSQHALGTAVDFFPSNWRFAKLPEYEWLRENAGSFGFSETYPKNNALRYPWEAWHWNYTPPTAQLQCSVDCSNLPEGPAVK